MSATLVSLWAEIRRRLEEAGVESPVLDARLLLEAGAGVARLDIVTEPRRRLSTAQVEAVETLVRRRVAREPLAYILGRKPFWKHEFAVSPAVLIPRPETETLVHAALALLAPEQPARVLDLGVGSGAILLSVLSERPHATGVGVDLSAEALGVAEANADAFGLSERVDLRQADWRQHWRQPFDLVLSNPPYIASSEIAALAPEIVRYEPRQALDGGADGLDAYRAIAASLPGLLKPGAAFALEVGAAQAEAVREMAVAQGLETLPPLLDLAGIARVVTGKRQV